MRISKSSKENKRVARRPLERVASGSCAGGDWQPCLSDLIESANNAACVETARVRVQPDATRVQPDDSRISGAHAKCLSCSSTSSFSSSISRSCDLV
ncbi:hypothetical protein EVAR_30737_1 [Eumeta japonica]|uniref:Uncharacterized protein n=1 Tax=Eumeta variegata TaxID=151549 RepID=A0A4C1V841_EUMVA|nr:hypothetical protein EVAR_30737_1 [Eumeta japonica]